jgi:hypothetical protein
MESRDVRRETEPATKRMERRLDTRRMAELALRKIDTGRHETIRFDLAAKDTRRSDRMRNTMEQRMDTRVHVSLMLNCTLFPCVGGDTFKLWTQIIKLRYFYISVLNIVS